MTILNGISVAKARGVGDTVQFSSLPENYFRATGQKLVDVDRSWIFDHNPYVVRDYTGRLGRVIDMWNFAPKKWDWPVPGDSRPPVYHSNAEIWARVWGVAPVLIRPRLYRFEEYPFEKRELILLHTDGKSHGKLQDQIIRHVIEKYGPTGKLRLIGKSVETFGLERIETATLWDLAEVVSKARMLIGSDSGPSWIAACYPDVIIKKVRQRPTWESYRAWTPLAVNNFHSHWDDRIFQIFNTTDDDIGPFQSYRRI